MVYVGYNKNHVLYVQLVSVEMIRCSLSLSLFVCGIVVFICVCSIARTGCCVGYVKVDLTLLSLSIKVFEFELSLSLPSSFGVCT